MTTTAIPANITAAFFIDPVGDHTVIKLRPPDPGKPEFAMHAVASTLGIHRGIAWLDAHGWNVAGMADVNVVSETLWTVRATRKADAQTADTDAAEALARIRSDIAHDPWTDGAQWLLEYLADHGEPLARELAGDLLRLRDAQDHGDDNGDDMTEVEREHWAAESEFDHRDDEIHWRDDR
jgi:hypothetical protein